MASLLIVELLKLKFIRLFLHVRVTIISVNISQNHLWMKEDGRKYFLLYTETILNIHICEVDLWIVGML